MSGVRTESPPLLAAAFMVARATFSPVTGALAGDVLRVCRCSAGPYIQARHPGSAQWRCILLSRVREWYGADENVWRWLEAHGVRRSA